MFAGLALLLFGGLAIAGGITLAIVWMGISYSSRKSGLIRGATERELQKVMRELSEMRADIKAIRETQADLTLMLEDLPRAAIGARGRQEEAH